jgi:hypothetical protein
MAYGALSNLVKQGFTSLALGPLNQLENLKLEKKKQDQLYPKNEWPLDSIRFYRSWMLCSILYSINR